MTIGALQLSDGDESTTEGAVASQGQATPVGADTGKREETMDHSPTMTPSSVGSSGPGASGGKIGVRGCHDLRLAGEAESRTYSLASGKELNEGGRDYNTRYCDMTTDGGGWTVIFKNNIQFLPAGMSNPRSHLFLNETLFRINEVINYSRFNQELTQKCG